MSDHAWTMDCIFFLQECVNLEHKIWRAGLQQDADLMIDLTLYIFWEMCVHCTEDWLWMCVLKSTISANDNKEHNFSPSLLTLFAQKKKNDLQWL